MSRGRRFALAFLAVLVALVTLAPMLAPHAPERQHARMAFAPPMPVRVVHDGELRPPFFYPLRLADPLERTFVADTSAPTRLRFFSEGRLVSSATETPWLPLGGDPLGRDVLSRLLLGGRTSLLLALLAVILTLAVGGIAGALAGFIGGRADRVLMICADFLVVLPLTYAVVTLRAALPLVLSSDAVFWWLVATLVLAGWPLPARGVRALVRVERSKPYAEAAYAMGAGPLRILLRHLLPAASGHLLTQGLLLFPACIFAEATLSFLGLGFAEPHPSWGVMLQDAGRVSTIADAPWLLAPAAAMVATVLALQAAATTDFKTDESRASCAEMEQLPWGR